MPSFFCIPLACNRQIDSLDKRQNNLQAVPHDIDRYRSLEELLLSMNHIKELPKALFRLSKLRLLDLSDNDISFLPPEIALLGNIVELNLSRNNISDLPEQARECKALMILDLSSNPITRLPDSIAQCTSLTHLGLNDVSLTQLPTDIGHLTNLRSLEVRENLIRTLPPSITQLHRLQVLDLGQNELDQLPNDTGSLVSLRELYVDDNDLEALPEQIVLCKQLEQLDVSQNKLAILPIELGELDQLTDVNFSDNAIQVIPDSIGRMRKLNVLKVDKNALTHLTRAIGQCESLTELYLTENLLMEIPATIGNLRQLKTLNVDKNQLTSIPPMIGGCTALSVLSLRENKISELPMDIGKCERLTVLDLCNNRLSFLPFTINVLFKLQALWLSENQSQAMLKLQQVRDPRTGVKVLTCYLLPQESAHGQEAERGVNNRAFVGGPKVHFDDHEATVEDEKAPPLGSFERHDTPHPKPHKTAGGKKNSIDGHLIPHEGSHEPTTLSLSKKVVESPPSAPLPAPRSALKFQSIPPTQYEPEMSRSNDVQSTSQQSITPLANNRTRTLKSPQSEPNVRRITVHRDEMGHLGLSIAGGQESNPFKEGDLGLFISKVNEFSPAERAGLRIGDKLLRVNETDLSHSKHDDAVRVMKDAGIAVTLTVLREDAPNDVVGLNKMTPEHTLDMSFMSDAAEVSSLLQETISAVLKRDESGSPGFAVIGGEGSGKDEVCISYVTPGGSADRHANILVGDRVLSINGTKMKGLRHDQVVALLTGNPQEDVCLVVQRSKVRVSSPLSTSALASTPVVVNSTNNTSQSKLSVTNIPRSPSVSVPINMLGDTTSWDGTTEEVQLVRDGKSLGLSIVGGSDHSSHPFGIQTPGVFISKIAVNSPAAKCQRLRIGDRILSVNDCDVRKAEHHQAVEELKSCGSTVRLTVTHDKQPAGLREVIIRREDGPLGISIHGGVNSPAANPLDQTDEGIFIDKVEGNSVCGRAGLIAGQRIVEVNGESLLGCSQMEAASVLRRSSELRLLVCDGYNKPSVPSTTSTSPLVSSTLLDNSLSSPPPSHSTHSATSPSALLLSNASSPITSPSPPPPRDERNNGGRVSVSSPKPSMIPVAHHAVPTTTQSSSNIITTTPVAAPKPSRIPPPVMPKPSLSTSAIPTVRSENDGGNPETLNFKSKLKKFEHEIEIKRVDHKTHLPPPEKKPLISRQDMEKLVEEEGRKVAPTNVNSDKVDDFYDRLLEGCPFPNSTPSSIRTKKAENRAIAAGVVEPINESLSDAERRAIEQQKRNEWRAARYASLNKEKDHADEIMKRLEEQLAPLSSINEDHDSTSGQDARSNGRTFENSTHQFANDIVFADD